MSQLSLLFVDRAAQLFEIGYIISSADAITEKSRTVASVPRPPAWVPGFYFLVTFIQRPPPMMEQARTNKNSSFQKVTVCSS